MAQLARVRGSGAMAHVDALAEAEAVPANYLVQILNELRGAGLIVSRRGKQGGYALARDPGAIRLSEIAEAMDADLLKAKVEGAGESGARVAEVWRAIGADLRTAVDQYTVEDLTVAEPGGMYYI